MQTTKSSYFNDTIVAISTPAGVGGIAVVRLSGSEAAAIAARHCDVRMQARHAAFALFKADGQVVDEVVLTYFQAPQSYTGEDVVEISCHGSLYVQQALLQALVASGARMAEPGEFTQRAFLNGRMDLSQAEAVADLIDATNRQAHALAVSQLRGAYAQSLRSLRQRFVELTSLLELELDFSEEDVEFADRSQLIDIVGQLQAECQSLADTFRQGNAIRNGVPVAIVGRPNVGKSTLLNALVGDDRAIVSDIAGTTRDTIEDTMVINGICFRFIDTAGIRQSGDQIETAGIERSYAAAAKARIVLYLVDADATQQQAEAELDDFMSHVAHDDRRIFILQTKTDIHQAEPLTLPQASAILPISVRQGRGMEDLRHLLSQTVSGVANDSPVVTNQRHYDALRRILQILPRVQESLCVNLPADLVVIDIRDALYHLGTITGQVASPEILHTIFSRFCVGK